MTRKAIQIFVNEISSKGPKQNENIKNFSRNTSLGSVFAEILNHTIRNLPRSLFLKREMLIGLNIACNKERI